MKLEEIVGELLRGKKLTLSTAESCTGGSIAALVTSVSGSSAYFNGGIVAYSNEVKMALLHVSAETLEKYGAVSRETVTEMARGAMKALKTDCAVATSGIAGPGGGSREKPVGTVYVSVRSRQKEIVRRLELYKEYENLDRRKIRMLTTETALRMVLELYEQKAEA